MKIALNFTFFVITLLFGCSKASEKLPSQIKDFEIYLDEGYKVLYNEEEKLLFYPGGTHILYIKQYGLDFKVENSAGWSVNINREKLKITAPEEVKVTAESKISITTQLEDNSYKQIEISVIVRAKDDSTPTLAWDEFISNSKNNVLLDFSYAGYKHGEVGPPDVNTLGYKTFNIEDYGGDGTDDISDRQAFIDAYNAVKAEGKGILYIPEGRFILHDDTDNVDGQSFEIKLEMSNIILKGAGRDKSFIVMKTPNLPKDPNVLYSSPGMLTIGHNSGLNNEKSVTGNAKKGVFSIEVESTSGIGIGDWVCLHLKNNDPELIAEELYPYEVRPEMTRLLDEGVIVEDYHQVVTIEGKKLIFKEPIMRAVDAKWGWKVSYFRNYTNVGIEDLTFEGNCKKDFIHHDSWEDDGAYKPINLKRLTNSWMRRLRFTSVSEASSISMSANVSVFDVEITGRRGHSAIRSARSSRVFIGKVSDFTDGRLVAGGYGEGVGQYHACGVSKPSIGSVLWNLDWGYDSSFESHATQPRATLIDNCTGALLNGRAGGAESELPNHLADLTLWNLNVTKTNKGGNYAWWDHASKWIKTLPPIIVGIYGVAVNFDSDQVIRNESSGMKVYPESLYEAQLQLRLGYLPQWIQELKSK